MALRIKARTVLRPLTSLACHGVRMFARLWCYLGQPIFRNIAPIANSPITHGRFTAKNITDVDATL